MGSKVKLISFQKLSETEYVLVVEPLREGYWAMKGCAKFEVRGNYTYKNRPVTPEGHAEALSFLESLVKENKNFGLGSFGGGFKRVNSAERCVVKSKGLIKDGNNIYSFHDPV